jgi:hypothetical protein
MAKTKELRGRNHPPKLKVGDPVDQAYDDAVPGEADPKGTRKVAAGFDKIKASQVELTGIALKKSNAETFKAEYARIDSLEKSKDEDKYF